MRPSLRFSNVSPQFDATLCKPADYRNITKRTNQQTDKTKQISVTMTLSALLLMRSLTKWQISVCRYVLNAKDFICTTHAPQLFEAEMRCAVIEAETREEVMHEMEERMRSIEQMYSRRLMTEVSL